MSRQAYSRGLRYDPRRSIPASSPHGKSSFGQFMTGLIPTRASESPDYPGIHGDIVALLEAARHAAARSVNALMTASYWEIGRRIVEFEQGGQDRAAYGQALLKRLSVDLTTRFGRGFSERNLEQMRLFYLA